MVCAPVRRDNPRVSEWIIDRTGGHTMPCLTTVMTWHVKGYLALKETVVQMRLCIDSDLIINSD